MPSIHIINPRCAAPSYFSSEAFGQNAGGGWTEVVDLAIATVAALVPPGWEIRLTDEDIAPADLDDPAEFVAITGKVSQRRRMVELAEAYRARGRCVLIGGSFATLSPEAMRPHADVLVTGELEELAPRLFADLAAGRWESHYDGGRADIRLAPVPRWDLYPTRQALTGALQTTRGCPFNCEFCDVIQYQGRKQRHKTIDQVLEELAALHRHGFRDVFLVDDNFTVHRRWAREVLTALAEWNAAQAEPVGFITQASTDIARDTEMLELASRAGMRMLFMGIETTNEDSLRETGKKQNLLLPMREAVGRVVGMGMGISAGIIVGFDHDGPEIFEQLLAFFQSAPLPALNVGVLTAPPTTDLYARLRREGRLQGDDGRTSAGSPFETNILPLQMSQADLLEGTRRLATELYRPSRYLERMRHYIAEFGEANPALLRQPPRSKGRRQGFRGFGFVRRGPEEAEMLTEILRAAAAKPAVLPSVMHFLGRYEQARHVLDHAASLA